MFGVRPDRFDHQVESIGAVDLARYAVRLVRRDELGFGEVVQTINALRVAVLDRGAEISAWLENDHRSGFAPWHQHFRGESNRRGTTPSGTVTAHYSFCASIYGKWVDTTGAL